MDKIIDEPFDHNILCDVIENISLTERKEPGVHTKYLLYGKGGFVGDLCFGACGVTIFKDNFPGQKKYYQYDLPIRTFRDLILDLQRVGFEIEVKEVSNG